MSKEKKGKKGKKAKNTKESYYEGICNYKISVKRKDLEDLNTEYNKLTDLNKSLKQRNEHLVQTREANFSKTLRQYKSDTNDFRSIRDFNKDDVLNELKSLLRFKAEQEKELLSIRRNIKNIDKQKSEAKRELKSLVNFKEIGTVELDMKTRLLKKEISDMTENFSLVSDFIKKNMTQTVSDIEKNTQEAIENNNKRVAQKAFKELDKDILEMSRDNQWMREKIEHYEKDLAEIQAHTTSLENENIKLMKYLFEFNNEELKSFKSIFQTQFIDGENLEKDDIMEVDLTKLDSVRPNSSLAHTMKRINEMNIQSNKVLALTHDLIEEEGPPSYRNSTKTLCLIGNKKELHRPRTPTKEELDAEIFNDGDKWPVTQDMLAVALYGEND